MTMIPNSAVTHGGRFHADDVFSSALLRLLNPKIKIRRVMRLPENFDGLAFDIGGGDFDHHQNGAPVRENGVPYAAFGLLWRAFGDRLIPDAKPRGLISILSSRLISTTIPVVEARQPV